jgi:arsenate reductase
LAKGRSRIDPYEPRRALAARAFLRYAGDVADKPNSITLYHNPKCSKSRQTLELLRQNGVEPEIIEYLKAPPSVAELDSILRKLGMQPRELLRVGEEAYTTAGLNDPSLGREELLARMVANPSVIERPIVVKGERAAIGRPPENALDVLEQG